MFAVPARKLNVMIVDDDPSMVVLLRTYLAQQLGCTASLHVSTDAAAALDHLEFHGCDLLITDIEMPGLNGLTLLRAAKARNAWTQVVFITGHTSVDRLVEAIELGASDYLLKPLDRDELSEVVGQICRRLIRWESALLGTFADAT